ncbi:hypothetical protein I546_6402 [Mycobacterium kansasii 732]|nr:hypothetical protein I546_6402 [Mycobacterium kansasii 732]
MNGFGGASGPNTAAARAAPGNVDEITAGTTEITHAARNAVGTANIAAGNRTKVPSRALGYRGFWRSRTTTRQQSANDFDSRLDPLGAHLDRGQLRTTTTHRPEELLHHDEDEP